MGATLLWCLAAAPSARAANDDGIPIGLDAAQTAAAVTATVTGGAAAFYNPAGLAQDRSSTIDASLSAYGFNVLSSDAVLTGPEGEVEPATYVDWVLVPSLVAYVRQFGSRWSGSLGVYVPKTQDYALRASLTTNEGTHWLAVEREAGNAYYVGFGAGVRINARLRLGGSVFGTYETDSDATALAGGVNGQGGQAASLTLTAIDANREYGLTARAGLQWEILQELVLGVTIYAPSITLIRIVDQATIVSVSNPMRPQDNLLDIDDQGQRKVSGHGGGNPGVRWGLAYRHARGWAALDGTLNFPITTGNADTNREFSWNLRAGTMYQLRPKLQLGAGLFSDRNPYRAAGFDFYGFTCGLNNTRAFPLRNGGELRMVSGISVRYAYGFGKLAGLSVPALTGGAQQFEFANTLRSAHSHELGASVGSSIEF